MERKPAGVRTYALVAIGAAMFTVIGSFAFPGTPNVASQIVTGIGFLGAGMILHTKGQVLGLTTAAGLWVAAAVGMATGAGMYIVSIGAAVLLFAVLQFLHPEAIDHLGLDGDSDAKSQPIWSSTARSRSGGEDKGQLD